MQLEEMLLPGPTVGAKMSWDEEANSVSLSVGLRQDSPSCVHKIELGGQS
jgi:hypothetical protein